MKRRSLLKGGIAASALFAMPGVLRAQSASPSVLKFVPTASLSILDPVVNTSAPTRMHGFMVFDTLYGLDENFQPHPQMAEGHTVSEDGLTWEITLREGLRFHDGSPVLARDAVASIKRWAQRDNFGRIMMSATEELVDSSDNVLTFRLSRPFPLLPNALGKVGSFIPVIMPERLAQTEPTTAVSEMIGSGPFRFKADEYVPGAMVVYEKNEDYVPRADGPAGHGSAPKVVHFDRVEWHIIPDPSTALVAVQTGEVDWWESPLPDFMPLFENSSDLQVVPSSALTMFLRLNHLNAPFDKPEVRRLVRQCINRTTVMQAAGGAGEWSDDVGIFNGSMANDEGLAEAFPTRTDFDQVREELAAAGYQGERIVMLVGTDGSRNLNASQVLLDTFQRMGLNVDFQTMDWGTVSQRRASQEPIENGGWSCFVVGGDSEYFLDQATNFFTRGNGRDAWFGWPDSPRLEELNTAWFAATDHEEQLAIARQIQAQSWEDVPYIPLGEIQSPGVASTSLTGFQPGFAKFHGVRRV